MAPAASSRASSRVGRVTIPRYILETLGGGNDDHLFTSYSGGWGGIQPVRTAEVVDTCNQPRTDTVQTAGDINIDFRLSEAIRTAAPQLRAIPTTCTAFSLQSKYLRIVGTR